MKKCQFALAALSLLMACTPEGNGADNNQSGNGGDKIVHVTGISLDRNSATIKEGEYITLVATVTPSNADNKSVSWSSSSDAVATVDASGKVTGVKAGSATITATTEDGGKTATCAVTVQQNHAPSVTVGAEHVSAVSVELQGKAQVDNKGTSLVLGFQYYKVNSSDSPSVTTLISANADEDNNYTVVITGLEPSTTYCYWSFVRQNSQDTYGETKEFTTKDVASLLETKEASGIEAVKATLNAKLDLTDVKYKDLAYGFLWGTSESSLNTDIKCTEIKDKTITAPLTDLSHKTQYWYKAYVTLDSQTFYSEVKTFTTDVVPVESVSLDKTEYTFHTIGNTFTLTATVLPADATDKSVSWTSDKEDVATVDANGSVTAKGNGKATITVTTKDQGKTASCEITVVQWVTSISLDNTSLSLEIGDEVTLSVTSVLPDNANDKTYTWSSSDSAIASIDNSGMVTAKAKGKATIKATANDGNGVFASCAVTVFEEKVDMGIKTSDGKTLYWSTRNLCESGFVNSPVDYGDYFAWGETEPKEDFDWSTYKWGTSFTSLTKYNTDSSRGPVDNKTVLEPEDDVAHVKLGGKWRLPTDAEWSELLTKCTWTWVTNYNGSGINGRLVKATNGNSIFLPAAGERVDNLYDAGSCGYYWSSSLSTDDPSGAWYVDFYLDSVYRSYGSRFVGRSVRPVSE